MKRALLVFGLLIVVAGAATTGPSTAQESTPTRDDLQATISTYQTQVASLRTRVANEGDKADSLATKVKDLRTEVAELRDQGVTPTPTESGSTGGAPESAEPSAVGGNAQDLIPAGTSGTLAVVAVGPYARAEIGLVLPVVIRNNTDRAVAYVSVAGAARSPDGALIASGRDRNLSPNSVEPGGLTFGYVDFDGVDLPSDTKFELDAQARPLDEVSELGVLDFTILSVNEVDGRLVGEAENRTNSPIWSSLVDAVCFDDGGSLQSFHFAGIAEDTVQPGERVTFQIQLDGKSCPRYLVSASGFEP